MSSKLLRAWPCLVLLFLVMTPSWLAAADALSLQEAETLAVERDPTQARYQATAAASRDDAEAAARLPNPVIVGEAMNLPVDDGLRLDRTPMTQLAVGVRQTFPRGDSRQLASARETTRADAEGARADDAVRQARLGVRRAYLEARYQSQLLGLLDDKLDLLADLRDVSEREFASGLGSSQSVLEMELEHDRLQDRISATYAEESAARAELARWVGREAAGRELDTTPPSLPSPGEDDVTSHPLVRAQEALIDSARYGVDLAHQGYRPEWSVQLGYGRAPGARGMGGVDRLSAMVMLDLPLFDSRRQDSEVAASRHRRDAALFALNEKARDLEARRVAVEQRWRRLGERDARFSERLLPSAHANAEAAEQAYRAGTIEFSDLVRARITDVQTRLDALRVATERLQTQAELLYLWGDAQ